MSIQEGDPSWYGGSYTYGGVGYGGNGYKNRARKEFGEILAGPEDIDNRDLHAQRWIMVLVRVCVYVYTLYFTIILK